jgi:DNA-binding NarL/FixJ family response regulator
MNTIRVLVIGGGEALPMRESTKPGLLEQIQVTQKPTLTEGLDAAQESPFQLVLLDLSLPDTSASESVTKILRMAQDFPVIAFVNDGETAKAVEALCAGAQGFLLIGCNFDSLSRTIQYAMERKQLTVDRQADRRQMTKDNEQLIAHLSHEFRNALTCIFQFGNILIGGLAGELSEEQREYLGIMLENASRIRSVLDGLTEGALAGIGESPDKKRPLPEKTS